MDAKWVAVEYLKQIKKELLNVVPDPLLKRNDKLFNLHRGERCFILGSGHSIKQQDLSKLEQEMVFTQNHFHAHEQIRVINPQYHVVVPKYQPLEFDEDWRTWLRSMDERLPPETVMFFGKNTKYLVDEMSVFTDRVHYIQSGGSTTLTRRAPIDLTKRIMPVPTVLPQCLAIALYMGFQEIYLLGFDLDQVCRMNDRSKVRFYGLSPVTDNKAEIAEEEAYGASGHDWFTMWIIWRQCNLLKKAAEERGQKIINATQGGLLNMFERKDFESVVRG